MAGCWEIILITLRVTLQSYGAIFMSRYSKALHNVMELVNMVVGDESIETD